MTAVPEPWGGPSLTLMGVFRRIALFGRSRHLVRTELGGPPSPLVYVGEGESLPWLAHVHGGRPSNVGTFPLRGLPSLAALPGKSLCIEINRLLAPLVQVGGFATLPWVRQVVDLESTRHLARVRSVHGTFGRKVRKFGFSYDVAVGGSGVEECYRDFYVPYLTWRFGALAHPRSAAQLRAAARHGFVLRVLREGHWLAAAVCRWHRDRVTVVAFGLREPYRELLRQGALSAVYYWLLHWARDHGVRYVDLLRSRPHLLDGVFRHKDRFGAEALFDPWPHSGLWIFPPTSAPLSAETGDLLVRGRGGGLMPLRHACRAAREEG